MEEIKPPRISVVIATVNRPAFVARCVQSVLDQDYRDFEILIVDQSADSRTKDEVEKRFGGEKRLRYFHSDLIGLSIARNFGCDKARGDIIAYIDDDAKPFPGWLKSIADAFDKVRPMPGVVGGKLLPEWEVPCPPWYPVERRPLLGIYDLGDEIREYPPDALPAGANFSIRKSLIKEMGGFDERLGFDEKRKAMIAGEDSLMALKVRTAGNPVCYYPKARALHFISSNKLTKSYYLKRQYCEGRTSVMVSELNIPINRTKLLGMLAWSSIGFFKDILLVALNVFNPTRNAASRRMLNLGILFCRYGIFTEAARLLFSGRKTAGLKKRP